MGMGSRPAPGRMAGAGGAAGASRDKALASSGILPVKGQRQRLAGVPGAGGTVVCSIIHTTHPTLCSRAQGSVKNKMSSLSHPSKACPSVLRVKTEHRGSIAVVD